MNSRINSTPPLQSWTVVHGAAGYPFHCWATSISGALVQCLEAFPHDAIVSAALDSGLSAGDFVVVGLPEACQFKIDGVMQSGPWFILVNKATGELAPDLLLSGVAIYLSHENAQEALEFNVKEYALTVNPPEVPMNGLHLAVKAPPGLDEAQETGIGVTLDDLLATADGSQMDDLLRKASEKCHYDRELDVAWTYWHYGRHSEFAAEKDMPEMSMLFAAAWKIGLRLHDHLEQMAREIRDEIRKEIAAEYPD